jgi:hypothetical protein
MGLAKLRQQVPAPIVFSLKYIYQLGDRLVGVTSPVNDKIGDESILPVGVHLNGLGHVVVDDEGDVFDVDTSTRHIGGH